LRFDNFLLNEVDDDHHQIHTVMALQFRLWAVIIYPLMQAFSDLKSQGEDQ